MARSFNSTSHYLEYAGAVRSGNPISVAAWFYVGDVTAYRTIFSLSETAANNNYYVLEPRGDVSGDPLEWQVRAPAGGVLSVRTSTSVTANTWHHALGVSASDTDHRVYLNGGGEGSSTSSRAPSGMGRTNIGVYHSNVFDGYFNGNLAFVTVWNVGLTAADAAALASGVHPFLVRPDAIVAYWPLLGQGSPEPELRGRQEMTVTGAAVVASPRLFEWAQAVAGKGASGGAAIISATAAAASWIGQTAARIATRTISGTAPSGAWAAQTPTTAVNASIAAGPPAATWEGKAPSVLSGAVSVSATAAAASWAAQAAAVSQATILAAAAAAASWVGQAANRLATCTLSSGAASAAWAGQAPATAVNTNISAVAAAASWAAVGAAVAAAVSIVAGSAVAHWVGQTAAVAGGELSELAGDGLAWLIRRRTRMKRR